MPNHIHCVLRSQPDVVKLLPDEEVARRWYRLFPKRRELNGDPAEPNEFELSMILNDTKRLDEIWTRISNRT